MTGLYLVR